MVRHLASIAEIPGAIANQPAGQWENSVETAPGQQTCPQFKGPGQAPAPELVCQQPTWMLR